METIYDIVFELNIMLYAKEFDQDIFKSLLKEVKEKYHPKIGMLDLVYYNKVRKKELWDLKIKAVKNEEFEKAASYRTQEILGQNLEVFKKRFKVKKSIFHFVKNYLVYMHVGNARNDGMVRGFFKK